MTMYQCPKSGGSHFYLAYLEPDQIALVVYQCPKSGGSHFYSHCLIGRYEQLIMGINALSRAVLISTWYDNRTEISVQKCINALSRAVLISTLESLDWLYERLRRLIFGHH